MINVSNEFKKQLASDNRNYLEYADITLKDGTILHLTNKNLWNGGLSVEDAVSSDNSFDIGAAIINKGTLTINNIYDDFSDYVFEDAKVIVWVGIALDKVDETVGRNLLINSRKYKNDSPLQPKSPKIDGYTVTDMYCEVVPGGQYTIQCQTDGKWGSHSTTAGIITDNCTLWLYYSYNYDPSNKSYDKAYLLPVNSMEKNGIWHVIIPDNVHMARVRVDTYSDGETPSQVAFWDFKMEEGNIATGWTIAPEDVRIEKIRKGTYAVDEPSYNGSIITLSCLDNMRKFDRAYSESKLTYPATLNAIVRDACSVCGVTLQTVSFPHDDFVVQTRPTDEAVTFREIISWAAQIVGRFCRCDIYGRLELKWYDQKSLENPQIVDWSSENPIGTENAHWIKSNYSSPVLSLDDVVITGVRVVEKNENEGTQEKLTTYQSGSDGYVISIENNGLIQDGAGQSVAGWLGEQLIGVKFRKATVSHASDPTIEAGDIAVVTDRKGNNYNIIVSSTKFSTGSSQNTVSAAENPARNSAARYSAQTKNYVEWRNAIEKEKTEREKALEALGERLENSPGVFTTVETQPDGGEIYYLHNKPNLNESDMVWKMTAEAWGVSTEKDDEGNFIWNAGMTVNGEAIVRILSTIGLNADWINTGALAVKDNDGNVLFNADIDTGRIDIVADSFSLRGKTIAEIAKESTKDYVDAVVSDAVKDVNTQHFFAYEPTLSNQPASEWKTNEEKDKHIDDLFYNIDTKKMYRFIKKDGEYLWENFTDPDIQQALDDASTAQDTADGKRRVFISTPIPPYDAGDMWLTSTQNGKADIKTCINSRESGVYVSSDWVDPKYTDDTTAIQAIQMVQDKSGNYYGNYVPTLSNQPASSWKADEYESHKGDIFYNPTTGDVYQFQTGDTGLQIEFNSQSKTESVSYDYVEIYYEDNGTMKALPKLGGTIGDTVVTVPSNVFWLYWHTDSSQDAYYGFKIDNIKIVIVDKSEISGTTKSLPLYTVTEISGTTYPESPNHGNYGNDIDMIWKYTGSASSGSAQWVKMPKIDAQEVLDQLDQETVFNILTNGGEEQGIYMPPGSNKIYINGEYIQANTITGDKINAKNLHVYDNSGNLTLGIDSNGNVTIRASSFSLQGSSIQSIANSSASTYANSALSSAKAYTDNQLANFDPDVNLTQKEIFDILTNNGTTQGIYMPSGSNKIYINASYIGTGSLSANYITSGTMSASRISGGVLSLGGANNGNGILQIYDSYGNLQCQMDRVSINLNQSNIVLNMDGYLEAKKAKITGGYMKISGSSFGQVEMSNKGLRVSKQGVVVEPSVGTTANYGVVIDADGEKGRIFTYATSTSQYARLHGQTISCTGTKSRVINTENYGALTEYCYEMPTPFFGDVGCGKTDENGQCYVSIDDMFGETVSANMEYYVFLQKEGEGDLFVAEKTTQYFLVNGTPNLKFAWEIKVRQSKFEYKRLDVDMQDEYELDTVNYEAEAQRMVEEYYAGLENAFEHEVEVANS